MNRLAFFAKDVACLAAGVALVAMIVILIELAYRSGWNDRDALSDSRIELRIE